MKCDMDLVRDILFAVEASDETQLGCVIIEIPGRSKAELSYHICQMADAGLLKAQDDSCLGSDGYEWQAERLAWQGHEFLDAVREPEVWRRTKEGLAKVGNTSLEFVWELAKEYGKRLVKERLGIDIAGTTHP